MPINVRTYSRRKYEGKAIQIVRGDYAKSLLNFKKKPIESRP